MDPDKPARDPLAASAPWAVLAAVFFAAEAALVFGRFRGVAGDGSPIVIENWGFGILLVILFGLVNVLLIWLLIRAARRLMAYRRQPGPAGTAAALRAQRPFWILLTCSVGAYILLLLWLSGKFSGFKFEFPL